MNEKNFDFLKDNVKYLGFGEKQHAELQNNLAEGKESFQLNFSTEVNKKKFEASLQFRKSNNSDMYFLNNYKATLERSNGEKLAQTFYLEKGKGITSKEAYNLLDGRSVFKELQNKEGQVYKAWLQLDFSARDKHENFEVKQYHENYGYDLKEAVSKYPFNELDGAEKQDALMHSLQKGNVQSVTIPGDNGSEQKLFIEANPQFKSINIYDERLQKLSQEQRLELTQRTGISKEQQGTEQSLEKSKEKEQKSKQTIAEASGESPKKKNSRKKLSV